MGSDADIYIGCSIPNHGITIIAVNNGWNYYGGLTIFIVSCILLALLTGYFFNKSIKKTLFPLFAPLDELNTVANNMSNGILEYTARYREEDEIGTLCLAIEDSNSFIRSYISDVSDKLAAMADGDLTASIDKDYIGNFTSLKASINAIVDSLKKTMSVIGNAAEHVHSNAENVASGAGGLSEEVGSVSGLIEQVNQEIDEMVKEFSQSQEYATNSMKLSEDAASELDTGYKKMEELLCSMEDISDKSQLIAASTDSVHTGSSLAKATAESMKQLVEKTKNVNEQILMIAKSIDTENAVLKDILSRVLEMEQFSTNTTATSEELVSQSNELYHQVDKMNSMIEHFQLN